MNVIGISGLIGTQDYLIPYTRTSDSPLELTPAWRKTNYNGFDVKDIPAAGVIPVQVTLNGKNSDFAYKTFTLTQAVTTTAEEQTLAPADYAMFTEGVYYMNETSGELFFCLAKKTGYAVTFKRGLMGTVPAGITTSDVIDIMNTVRLDSASGSETQGVFTLEKGTAPLAANDKITIAIGTTVKQYVFKATATAEGEIAVGTDATEQATNIATALSLAFTEWSFTTSSGDVVGTQKTGYAKPFTVLFSCEAGTAANAFTYDSSSDTPGVAKTYDAGNGFVIYKEMPRNLATGQPVYPAYNYNVNGK